MGKTVTAKPKVGGVVYFAPQSSTLTLPTDATTELNSAFKSVGHISEDGIGNDDVIDTTEIKDMRGDVVLVVATGHSDKFDFVMIDALDENALKVRYGSGAVTGTPDTGMTVVSNIEYIGEEIAVVIEMILQGGYVKRVVIPHCSVADVEKIQYKSTDPLGYGVTLSATSNANGHTHIDYTSKAAA